MFDKAIIFCGKADCFPFCIQNVHFFKDNRVVLHGLEPWTP